MAAPARKRAESKKTTAETAKQPTKIPQPHGGALNSGGTPGNKGGPGRPPSVLKAFTRELLEDEAVKENVKRVLMYKGRKKGEVHPQFVQLYTKLYLHTEGIPGKAGEGDGAGDLRVSMDL